MNKFVNDPELLAWVKGYSATHGKFLEIQNSDGILIVHDALCKVFGVGTDTIYKPYFKAAFKCTIPTDDDVPYMLRSVNDVGMLRKGFARFLDAVLSGGFT